MRAVLVPVVSFTVTWLAVFLLLRRLSGRMLDHPNERSLHERPIPRSGGIAVAAGIAAGALGGSPIEWWPMWVGALFLVVVSFFDDLIGLPIVGRLIAHFLAAGLCVTGLVSDRRGMLWVPVAILATVWMINLYNFMDGMDGLAGGMAVCGFGFLGTLAWMAGHQPLMVVNGSIAAAAGAFLLFNVHPARIFLGDAGSTVLGFLAAGLGLIGWNGGTWPLEVPLLVFSPFIVDASVTLARRIIRGEKFWQAHRSHFYQRLVLSGWSHRKTALAEYALMVVCAGLAWLYQVGSDRLRLGVLLGWSLLFIGLMAGVGVAERVVRGKRVTL